MRKSEFLNIRITKAEKEALEKIAEGQRHWVISRVVREMIQKELKQYDLEVDGK
jgi:hypothetical protein